VDKKEAKKMMLKKLKKSMQGEMHGKMKEGMSDKMQKVVVSSDTKEGLEEGLSKAQQILKKKLESGDEECLEAMDGGIKSQKDMKRKDMAYYKKNKDPYYEDLDKMNDEEFLERKKKKKK